MSFLARATIALLAGVGAGTIGMGTIWLVLTRILQVDPGIGYDAWILSAIFLPGPLVALVVFQRLSKLIEGDGEYDAEHV